MLKTCLTVWRRSHSKLFFLRYPSWVVYLNENIRSKEAPNQLGSVFTWGGRLSKFFKDELQISIEGLSQWQAFDFVDGNPIQALGCVNISIKLGIMTNVLKWPIMVGSIELRQHKGASVSRRQCQLPLSGYITKCLPNYLSSAFHIILLHQTHFDNITIKELFCDCQ